VEQVPTLEVFADVWCPFAHVGLRAAAAFRSVRGREDVPFLIRSWPLELVNGVPLVPATTAEHVRELREQVAPDLFRGFDVAHFPTSSLRALALAELGYRRDAHTGEAVSFALREALFEEGRDVASDEVLGDLATRYGLDPLEATEESVRASWSLGQARGVRGSPHFFCSGRDAFCPTLEVRRDGDGHLEVAWRAHELETFLSTCFVT
jgi:predicted DsbA family dithiol-disulfide isomerase